MKKLEIKTFLKRIGLSVASNECYLTHNGLIDLSMVLAISQTTNDQVLIRSTDALFVEYDKY